MKSGEQSRGPEALDLEGLVGLDPRFRVCSLEDSLSYKISPLGVFIFLAILYFLLDVEGPSISPKAMNWLITHPPLPAALPSQSIYLFI